MRRVLGLKGEQACHKLSKVSEGGKSSTWRELSAIDNALKSVIPAYYQRVIFEMVFGQSVRQPYGRIIQNGSMKKAIKIFQCCAENQISLNI